MKPTMCQHLEAPNDVNGNPRRLFVLLSRDGSIVKVIDEGYAGKPEECIGLIQLPTLTVPSSQYRKLLSIRNAGFHGYTLDRS